MFYSCCKTAMYHFCWNPTALFISMLHVQLSSGPFPAPENIQCRTWASRTTTQNAILHSLLFLAFPTSFFFFSYRCASIIAGIIILPFVRCSFLFQQTESIYPPLSLLSSSFFVTSSVVSFHFFCCQPWLRNEIFKMCVGGRRACVCVCVERISLANLACARSTCRYMVIA